MVARKRRLGTWPETSMAVFFLACSCGQEPVSVVVGDTETSPSDTELFSPSDNDDVGSDTWITAPSDTEDESSETGGTSDGDSTTDSDLHVDTEVTDDPDNDSGSISCSDELLPDETLNAGEHLCSENGKYRFGMSLQGNLALWTSDSVIWSAQTCCAEAHAIMQRDGNLVVYDGDEVKFASGTHGNEGAYLTVEDDGRAVVRLGDAILWATGPKDGGEGSDEVDASTLRGKVMAGYQGWFSTEGDGSGWGWRHWSNAKPAPDNISFDMWPDLREYDADELFATNFQYPDGSNAGLYSAYTPKTVERHVRWMKQYGIDGVFVQRFIGEAMNHTDFRDRVLGNIRAGSEKYGRVFANMYDISGGNEETLVDDIKNDWMHLVDDEKVTESDRYLKHDGRPVVAIWGFGVDGRPGTPAQALELTQWFREKAPQKYRAAVMGGFNKKWRTQGDWDEAFRSFDIISPWTVGAYADDAGADNHRATYIEPDLDELGDLGIGYMPVIFPGFSWYNLKEGAELNQIPRRGGRFFWHQAYNAIDAGCEMIYVAMFDEVDESTAIFKIAENQSQVPTTGVFLTLDADGEDLSSDWYLRLTGEATKMLRKEIPLTSSIPIE